MSVFIVPAGTTVIDSGEMLQWITAQLVPHTDAPPSLASLTKQTLIGMNTDGFDHWQGEPLSSADWSMLDIAWQALPPVANVTRTNWQKYKDAFDAWKQAKTHNAPEWVLAATFTDHIASAKAQRSNVFNKHYWALDAMLKSGTVRGIAPDRVRATTMAYGVLLPIDEARTYLESAGYSLSTESAAAMPAPAHSPTTPAPVVVAALVKPGNAGPKFSMTKAAMLGQHKPRWPTIERDMKDANENGLNSARAGFRGWIEADALEWARANNKLVKPAGSLLHAVNSMANVPGRKHTMED